MDDKNKDDQNSVNVSKEHSGGEAVSSPHSALGTTEFPSIIVRAYDDKPVVVYAIKMQDNGCYVNVGRVPPDAVLGWPLEDAFDYHVESYAQLVEAFERGDKGTLATIYGELRAKPRQFVTTLQRTSG